MNCTGIGKARDDGVGYAEGVRTVTENIGDVRTYRFQTEKSAILWGNEMKE